MSTHTHLGTQSIFPQIHYPQMAKSTLTALPTPLARGILAFVMEDDWMNSINELVAVVQHGEIPR